MEETERIVDEMNRSYEYELNWDRNHFWYYSFDGGLGTPTLLHAFEKSRYDLALDFCEKKKWYSPGIKVAMVAGLEDKARDFYREWMGKSFKHEDRFLFGGCFRYSELFNHLLWIDDNDLARKTLIHSSTESIKEAGDDRYPDDRTRAFGFIYLIQGILTEYGKKDEFWDDSLNDIRQEMDLRRKMTRFYTNHFWGEHKNEMKDSIHNNPGKYMYGIIQNQKDLIRRQTERILSYAN